jgi:hypothetical protein
VAKSSVSREVIGVREQAHKEFMEARLDAWDL